MNRLCPVCKIIKNSKQFSPNKGKKDGLHTYCKPCFAQKMAIYRSQKPEHYRNIHLLNKYNITLNQYDEIAKSQKYKCAICEQPETTIIKKTGKKRELVPDHDHELESQGIMKVRGLLCFTCNGGLGVFKDDIDILFNAIKYLKKNKAT